MVCYTIVPVVKSFKKKNLDRNRTVDRFIIFFLLLSIVFFLFILCSAFDTINFSFPFCLISFILFVYVKRVMS